MFHVKHRWQSAWQGLFGDDRYGTKAIGHEQGSSIMTTSQEASHDA